MSTPWGNESLAVTLRLELLKHHLDGHDGPAELDEVLAWLEQSRANPSMRAAMAPLADAVREITGSAEVDELSLKDSVVFVRTVLEREVLEWTQPLMVSQGLNYCGLVVTERDGGHWALVQLMEEPGVIDGVQLGPTIQLGMSLGSEKYAEDAYHHLFTDPGDSLVYEVMHSEEGGRFFRDTITYAAVLASNPPEPIDDRFRWVSLPTLRNAITLPNIVNIHARTLLCMLT